MTNIYQVKISGENIILLVDGVKKRCGFYINVCVNDSDENNAFHRAKKLVINKLKENDTVDNLSFSALNFTLENIEILHGRIDDNFEQGFIWYEDTEFNHCN